MKPIRREFLSGSQLVFPYEYSDCFLAIIYILGITTTVVVLCVVVYVIPSTALLLYVVWHG